MPDNQPIIQVTNLAKSYREGFWRKKSRVLEGVSFSVPAGQIFGFLGANGAGKTTTIKIILGLQAAEAGEVSVLGHGPGDVRFKEKLGYLPERPYFQANLTADEFLDFNRRLYSPVRRGPENKDLLKLVGLPDAGSHALGGFSKGMLQRIGIAQALVNDPELVIFDEPMSGLDPVGRRDVRNLLLDLNKSGKTIFFSSHILSDIEALCQQIAFLEKGRLRYSGRVDDLLRTEKQEFEIVARLPRGKNFQMAGLQAVGDRHRLITDNLANARQKVEELWAQGAEVISFGPVQKSLEEALFGREGEAS